MRNTLLALLAACGGGLSIKPPSSGAPTGTTPTGTLPPTGQATGSGTGTGATGSGSGTGTGTATGTTWPTTGTGTGTGATIGWSHTATVDGSAAEYGVDETFAVAGGTVWLTWDASALYVAVQHPDVIYGGPEHFLVIYLGDGSAGTTVGEAFNNQTPALAVPAQTIVRWKADNSWNSRVTWNGAIWQDSPYWLSTGGSAHAEDPVTGVVEFRLPFTALGLGNTLAVHVSWVYEGLGYESSYAPSPSGSFSSGDFDPDYGQFWLFDRSSLQAPALYAPVP